MKKICSLLFCLSLIPIVWASEEVSVDDLVTRDVSELDRSPRGDVVSYSNSLSDVRGAVVAVISKMTVSESNPLMRRFSPPSPHQSQGMGSGVIVTENGYILTNNHVVEGADEISIRLEDGREFEATLVGTDPRSDIAIVKVEGEGLPTAVIADSDKIEVGDVVFAIGNPLGVGQTATMGIVSAKGRSDLQMIEGGYENFIQTDASINRGNSGGALVDALGRLIGINTMILTDGRTTGNIGIGFAVPSNLAHHVLTDIVEKGVVSRGFLGVSIQALDADLAREFGLSDSRGVLIKEVTVDSPADRAGMFARDIIVGVDGEQIDSPGDLKMTIGTKGPGTEVSLEIFRDGKAMTLTATLMDLNASNEIVAAQSGSFLEGVTVSAATDELREKYGIDADFDGIVVTQVDPESRYSNVLAEGVAIMKINGESISSVAAAVKATAGQERIGLVIIYKSIYRYIDLELK